VEVNPGSADAHLYHLGNNQLHRDIYREALRQPGIAVLHDAVLHHFFLGWLDREAYVREFAYNYGESVLASELWRDRARSAQDPRYFAHAMLRRIAETSRAVVVHNAGAARVVAAHCGRARVVEIPHLFRPPGLPPCSEVLRLRQALGLGPRTFLFGIFGHLRESKRLLPALRAFARVRDEGADAALLVAGEYASPDLARAAAPLLAAPRVLRAGYLPETDFWRFASAADASISLRFPTAGETSGITIRLMGIGKPVLVTGGPENSGFPENACVPVDPGPAEEEMLAAAMLWLARCPEAARHIGHNAARHIRERHSPEAAAALYWETLKAAC
jgi:glycosyltransferase involved in cell wall biosynthesis